jgi:subtilisin family serine protease
MSQCGVRLLRLGLAAIAGTGMLASTVVARERPRFQEGEVIVKFARGRMLGAMNAAAASVHPRAEVVRTMAAVGRPHIALLRFPKEVPVASVVGRFRAQPGVVYAEPNYLGYIPEIDMSPSQQAAPRRGVRTKEGRATADPNEAVNPIQAALIDPVKFQFLNKNNDPNTNLQYGWSWIGADVIWPDAAANPMIAIIDTGVDYMHPDLAGRVTKGTDWVNDDADPMDDNGHGTHVAGIAAAIANNAKGVAGVSKAMIYAVKVLGAEGSGTYFDIVQGIVQAANNPLVKILSLSLGGPCGSTTLTGAMDYAAGKGKLIVVAMGNDNLDVTDDHTDPSTAVRPVSYADAAFDAITAPVTMAIGAGGIRHYSGCPGLLCSWHYDYSCKAAYSNYATWMTSIAPGTAIYSTTPANREFWLGRYKGLPSSYGFLDGTSMATPMVAGSAARTFSAMPSGTLAADVKERLIDSGFSSIAWGQGHLIDTDGDGSDETECWPTGAGFDPATTEVSLPSAMKRVGHHPRGVRGP